MISPANSSKSSFTTRSCLSDPRPSYNSSSYHLMRHVRLASIRFDLSHLFVVARSSWTLFLTRFETVTPPPACALLSYHLYDYLSYTQFLCISIHFHAMGFPVGLQTWRLIFVWRSVPFGWHCHSLSFSLSDRRRTVPLAATPSPSVIGAPLLRHQRAACHGRINLGARVRRWNACRCPRI